MDSIALFVYMHLNTKEYNIKIGSVGNNEVVLRYMQELVTVSIGFKEAGNVLAEMLSKSEISSKTIPAKLIDIK